MRFFTLLIPAIFLFSFLFAAARRVKIYDAFVDGVKDAVPLLLSIFPYVATVTILCKLFEVSGLEQKAVGLIAPLFRFLQIPEELAPLVLIKPLSGSGGTAVLTELVERYGVDSYLSRCACVVYGSSETVFYVGAVYFSTVKKKRLAAALVISLFSYFLSVVLCCFLCKIL